MMSPGDARDTKRGTAINEHTVIVYSFIRDRAAFEAGIDRLKWFMHRFGRETGQGEVVFEVAGWLYSIEDFEQPPGA